MDYKETAIQICEKLGGTENLEQISHCVTRLRVTVKDKGKVRQRELGGISGVSGVVWTLDEVQIIIGAGTVNRVYHHLERISSKKEKEVPGRRSLKYWLMLGIKKFGDIFIPILPAIVAGGFLKGIVDVCGFMVEHQVWNMGVDNSVYVFAQLCSNAVYWFLPILIAYSAARVFGGNPYLGAVIGMILIHPQLQNAWTVATEGIQAYQNVFGGLYKVPLVAFQGHVLPVIISVWFMCMLEKRLHKIVPPLFDLFITPLVSIFVTGYLTYALIGPVFVKIEDIFLMGIKDLIMLPCGIGGFLMGGIYSGTVITGVHHMYTAISLGQLAKYGVSYLNPLESAANIAQGAAALAIAFKLKNRRIKGVAFPSACSAFMGITEPALFGVNLRYVRPFLAGALGGACGGWYAAVRGLGAAGTGVTGIFAMPLYLDHPVDYIITLGLSFGISFTLTWILGGKEASLHVTSPLQGEVIPLAEVKDPTFQKGVLGPGVGIRPTQGKVVAPFDGKVEVMLETGHAVILSGKNGAEILIHIGINTINLDGRYFHRKVEKGDRIKRGDVLVEFDLQSIASEGYDITTPVVLVNSTAYDLTLTRAPGKVKRMDELMLVD